MAGYGTAVLVLIGLLGVGCQPPERVWVEEDDYRWAELDVRRGQEEGGFIMRPAASTGLDFVNNLSGEQIAENRHRMHGSGVALGDVDGDGWTDMYLARLDGDNVLYRNTGGWKFEDVTTEAGVAAPNRYATGAVFADLEGDGDLDLLVTALGGPNAAFLNDGAGVFEEATHELGLSSSMGSTSMALADVEGDGDLDLYVANYKRVAMRDSLPPPRIMWDRVIQQEDTSYSVHPDFEDHYYIEIRGTKVLRFESAEEDYFYLNDGAGRFTRRPLSSGVFTDQEGRPYDASRPWDWALAARFQDMNGDGAPDLYVCNDFESPDYVLLNNGAGQFRDMGDTALRKTSNASMAVAFADANQDGHTDFFLADMLSMSYARRQMQRSTNVPLPPDIGDIESRPQVMQNTLLVNRGDATFAEVSHLSGLQASEWTWSSEFLDVDLDGFEDVLMTNGHAFDVQNLDAQQVEKEQMRFVRSFEAFRKLILEFPPLNLRNAAFRNQGDLSFEAKEHGWGLGAEADVSHGMAMADFDNDGDLDIAVNRLNKEVGIYENVSKAPRVAVRLNGAAPNTQGIGARIRLLGGATPVQVKEVISGGLYLSGSDPMYTFAAGTSSEMAIEVRWRNGKTRLIENVQPNRIYEIDELETAEPKPELMQASDSTSFAEVAVDASHEEAVFDDFESQPLLPRRLSQAGPAVVWADVDRDGDDDLVMGSGREGMLTYLVNDNGTLTRQTNSTLSEPALSDQAGILVLPDGRRTLVLVAMSNYERREYPSSIRVYAVEARRWRLVDEIPFGNAAIGPMAAADVDGDGDLDLFAGGMVVPGRYPADASSQLFLNEGAGKFTEAAALSEPFNQLGMVRGAAFGDADNDGDQDLALALEWGPITLMLNDGTGNFANATAGWGLDTHTGMWQGVSWGDFNGDGQLDLVASNWGWNTAFGQPERGMPHRLYWGDYDSNGVMEVLEAHDEPSVGGYVPYVGLNLLWYSLPYLRQRIRSFEAFSTMTIDRIISTAAFNPEQFKTAQRLGHAVFLNRGDGFDVRPLPTLAQVSPGFGVGVGDYNGDGNEDFFLAQNFFAERLEVPRSDAGRGLWLQGQGDGSFVLDEGVTTGIEVYGEQRGMAVSDFNEDGRLDIAVSQNGRELKVYANQQAQRSVRISLVGPENNPWGAGSQIRLVYSDGTMGPVRNVSMGSGYWSQHTMTQLLGVNADKEVAAAQVRWPDGSEQEAPVINLDQDVVITFQ